MDLLTIASSYWVLIFPVFQFRSLVGLLTSRRYGDIFRTQWSFREISEKFMK